MRELLLTFWQITLLRRGPQVLPASQFLMVMVLLGHLTLGVILALLSEPLGSAVVLSLFGTATMVLVSHLLLLLHRHPERLWQTVTALAGSEVAIGLLAIPATLLFLSGNTLQDIGVLISMLLFIWNIAIAGHIFHHALSVSRGIGVLYGVGYIALSIALSMTLFGGGR